MFNSNGRPLVTKTLVLRVENDLYAVIFFRVEDPIALGSIIKTQLVRNDE